VLKWPRNLVIPALCGGAATGPRQAAVAALEGLNVQADRQYDALDRPHSRFMLLQQVLRLALTVMFAIITSTAIETHWALCLFFVASCALNLICCLWYMPFRVFAIVRLQLCLHGASLWSALGLVLTLLYNDDQQVVGAMITFFGTPLVVQVLFLLATSRRTSVLQQPYEGQGAPTDPYLAELQLRLCLEMIINNCTETAAGSSMGLADLHTSKTSMHADALDGTTTFQTNLLLTSRVCEQDDLIDLLSWCIAQM